MDSKDTTTPATRIQRLKPLGKRLALAATTLLILALILEVCVRVFTDIQPSIKVTDPVFGGHYLPHFDGDVFVDEAHAKVHIRINADGFRGPDLPIEKAKDVRRIALIGDSFVAAIATSEAATTAVQLERLLNASARKSTWQVMNFGVSGAATGTELVTYQEVVRKYQPDIVLCAFYNGNDVADSSRKLSSANNRIYFELDANDRPVQMPFAGTRQQASSWLNRHSRLYIWQKRLIARVRHAYGGLSPGAWAYSAKPPAAVAESWKLIDKLVLEFRDRVERDDHRFAMIDIPEARQIYDDLWRSFGEQAGEDRRPLDREYPESQLTQTCSQGEVPLLLLRPSFRAATPARSSKEESEWLFIGGSGHFNDAGNLLAAEEILRFLIREGFVPEAGKLGKPGKQNK